MLLRNTPGPALPISQEIHSQKYRLAGESFEEAMYRIAHAIKDDDTHFQKLTDILMDMRFLPAGRVQCAMGSPRQVTAVNCLSGDTEVLTEDGFVRLDNLEGLRLRVLSPVSGKLEWADFKSYGEQELYEVEISHNFRSDKRGGSFKVYATKNHRWVLADGSVTDNLRERDLLRHSYCDIEPSKAGWMHGFIYGDGSKVEAADTFKVRLCGQKAEHLDHFPQDNVVSVTYPPSNRGDPVVRLRSSVNLKRIPPDTAPLDYRAGFALGLLDADGCYGAGVVHGSEEAMRWLFDHIVLAGFAPVGGLKTCVTPTNYGPRKQPLWYFRFKETLFGHRGYRVLAIRQTGRVEKVYCAEEPKYRQITLRNGLATGNCFVSGVIEDSMSSIMARATEAAETMRRGGGIGYDFSRLRPRGDLIKSLDSRSSGPISFMGIFDAVCQTISSAGHRRGAQMAVLRIDHPDIHEFVRAKHNNDRLTGFNVSVGVTDEFMHALSSGEKFALRFDGKVHSWIDPQPLWDMIMQSTWDWAEPGVIFLDTINRLNNLWYCERIEATNPCAEQCLPPFGACLLGSFNVTKYVSANKGFDAKQFLADISVVVRAMDNVVDRTIYPLPEQQKEQHDKRRMGLGVTGMANALEIMGHRYGTDEYLRGQSLILKALRDQAYIASSELAEEKGSFPKFDRDLYLQGNFVQSLPDNIQQQIANHGIRNSHLTSIAPTGTISLTADNISSGIEPPFSLYYDRTIRTFDGDRVERVEDYAYRTHGVQGATANEISAKDHVRVLAHAQEYVDSAVSKTCNVGDQVSFEEFSTLYRSAWELGCKGVTTFRAAGKRFGILQEIKEEPAERKAEACTFDPATGTKTCE